MKHDTCISKMEGGMRPRGHIRLAALVAGVAVLTIVVSARLDIAPAGIFGALRSSSLVEELFFWLYPPLMVLCGTDAFVMGNSGQISRRFFPVSYNQPAHLFLAITTIYVMTMIPMVVSIGPIYSTTMGLSNAPGSVFTLHGKPAIISLGCGAICTVLQCIVLRYASRLRYLILIPLVFLCNLLAGVTLVKWPVASLLLLFATVCYFLMPLLGWAVSLFCTRKGWTVLK